MKMKNILDGFISRLGKADGKNLNLRMCGAKTSKTKKQRGRKS